MELSWKDGIVSWNQLSNLWSKHSASNRKLLVEIMKRFEVAYPIPSKPVLNNSSRDIGEQQDDLLVPFFLPEERLSLVSDSWDDHELMIGEHQIGRVYHFNFVPIGFFPRLIVRCLHRLAGLQIPLCYWKSGLFFKSPKEQVLMEYNSESESLKIECRNDRISSVFKQVIEEVDSLLESYYKEEDFSKTCICFHCLAMDCATPHEFPLEDCIKTLQHNQGFLLCLKCSKTVRLDILAPDLSFPDLEILDPRDLTPVVEIGRGDILLFYSRKWIFF